MRHRAILTEAQAREIFVQRGRVASVELGEIFDISPKAVRDIWNGRLVCLCRVCACGRALREEGRRTWSAVNVCAPLKKGRGGLKKGSGGPGRALKKSPAKSGVGPEKSSSRALKKGGSRALEKSGNSALPAMDYKHALMAAFDFYQEEEEEQASVGEEDAISLFEDLVNEAE
jgi:hypothetical protein